MAYASPRLFVSYRRSDSEGSAGRLADALARQFGASRVFLDSARIPFGADFVRVVAAEIARADVVVVVIGPTWVDTRDDRGRRLDHEDDPVRFEIVRALDAKRRIVPVLVGAASAPRAADLPDVLAPIAQLNMATVRNVAFADDFDALVDALLGRQRGAVRTDLDHLRRLVVGARAAALVAPAIALIAALGAWAGAFDVFSLDTHLQRALLAQMPAVDAGPVLIAAIDAESDRRLDRHWPQPRAAWRASHAALVDRAAAAGARAVVFDLAFDCRNKDEPCDPEFAALAAAARRGAARRPPMTVVYGVRDPGDAGPRLAAPLRDSGLVGNVCLFDRGNGVALIAVNGIVLAVGAAGFHRLTRSVFPAPEQAMDRALLSAVFLLQPPFLASVLQPGLDLPVLVGTIWTIALLLERRWFWTGAVGIALVFSKETGILLYALVLGCYATWLVRRSPGPLAARLRALLPTWIVARRSHGVAQRERCGGAGTRPALAGCRRPETRSPAC